MTTPSTPSAPRRARRITETDQPTFPCWLYCESATEWKWQRRHKIKPEDWPWTHWLPDQVTAPTETPDEAGESQADWPNDSGRVVDAAGNAILKGGGVLADAQPHPDSTGGETVDGLDATGWQSVAREMSNNLEYYRGLLDKMAPYLGEKAFTADDGSTSDSPLRAKLLEMVLAEVTENADLRQQLSHAKAEVERLTGELRTQNEKLSNCISTIQWSKEVTEDLRTQLAQSAQRLASTQTSLLEAKATADRYDAEIGILRADLERSAQRLREEVARREAREADSALWDKLAAMGKPGVKWMCVWDYAGNRQLAQADGATHATPREAVEGASTKKP